MTKRWGWLAILPVLWAGLARADLPATAPWVDRDALIYAEIIRPAAVLDGLDDPRFQAGLAAIPGARKAIDDQKVKDLLGVVRVVASQLGTTPEKGMRDLLGGGVILAAEGEKGPERIILIVTPADRAFLDRAYAKVLELTSADASSKGKPAPFSRLEYRGVFIDSAAPQQAMAVVDGRLVVTNGPETLKVVIDRVKEPKGPGIAGHPGWLARRASAGPDAVGFAFARLDRLRAIDPAKYGSGPGNPGPRFLFGPWYEAARAADWASASLSAKDGRLALDLTLPNPPGGRSKALARYLPPKGSGAPAPLTPPRMIAGLGLWRDLSSIWEVRAEIFPPEALEKLAQLDTLAGQFFGGRDFGTGVLGSLSTNWRLVVARQDEAAMDPAPDVKFPAVALVVDLAPGDEEFATRLMSAFQSFVGLINIGAAQTKAPPLMLGSETFEGIVIATSKFTAPKPKPGDPKEPVDRRFNVSPSAARVGDTFILSSTLNLARDLVKAVQNPVPHGDGTLVLAADGDELARLVDQNRDFLVMQDMLSKGRDKATSEAAIGDLAALLRFLHAARLSAVDGDEGTTLRLEVTPAR